MKHLTYTSLLTGFALSLSLPAIAQEQLEEVVVTASGNETPLRQVGASVSVISAEDIQLQGNNALMDLMRTQPGISVSNTGGLGKQSSLRIRGEEGYRTLVMIDGIEMSDPTGTQVGTEIQHLQTGSEIDRVEILRGPQGFIYGADAGGVVNIFTTTSEEGFNAHIAAEAGAFSTQKANGHLGYGNNIGDILVSYSTLKSNGFNTRTSDNSNEADGYDNNTLHVKAGWNITDNLRAQWVKRQLDSESEYDNCGSSTEDCINVSKQETSRASLSYSLDTMQHTLGYATTTIERDFLTDQASTYLISGESSKADYLGSVELNSILTAVVGGDYKTEQVDNDAGDISRNQLGIFTELQTNVDNALYFTGGIRHDNNDDFGRHNSVRATAAWLPLQTQTETLKLRTSAGTGFRAPSLQEVAYNQGPWAFGEATDVVLQEEQSKGIDAGVEFYQQLVGDSAFSIETTFFYQLVENEIYFDPINWSGYFQAEGESSSKGVELAGEFTLNRYYTFVANATYNKTDTRDNTPRVRRPERTANVGVQASFLDNSLNLLANIRFVADVLDIGEAAMDDYNVLNVSANWQLNNWAFNARVENLLDQQYQEVTGFNTAERAFYAGAKFQF